MDYASMWKELKKSIEQSDLINRPEILIKMMGIEVNESRKKPKPIPRPPRAKREKTSGPF